MALNQEPHSVRDRFAKLLSPDYPLCRDDVVWMLESLKKKMADEASELSNVPQPQLLRLFQCFADTAMILIKQRNGCHTEIDRLRSSLREAAQTIGI